MTVHDLPKLLRTYVYNNVQGSILEEDALTVLDTIDWSEAPLNITMEYCKIKYPKGTQIISVIYSRGTTGDDYHVFCDDIYVTNLDKPGDDLCLYCSRENISADVISYPELDPNPKRGDKFYYRWDPWGLDEWNEKPITFTGGYSEDGGAIFEQFDSSFIRFLLTDPNLRKHNPDSKLDKIADEIIKDWGKVSNLSDSDIRLMLIDAMKQIKQ